LPLNQMEEKLVDIWKEVLKKDRIGTEDNYFSLGGDSLKAIQLVILIEKQFQVYIEAGDVYAYPCIKKLAALIIDRNGMGSLEILKEGYHKIEQIKQSIFRNAAQ